MKYCCSICNVSEKCFDFDSCQYSDVNSSLWTGLSIIYNVIYNMLYISWTFVECTTETLFLALRSSDSPILCN